MSQNNEKYIIAEDHDLLINARKPEGELGRELLNRMNKSHETLAQWGVSHLNIEKDVTILDIGCGGGINVERFLKMTDENVYGLDYSEISVEESTNLNKLAIENGRCEVIQGSVSELPFDDNKFDIVTGFETVYFWPDFVNDLKEVHRTLKDDGIIFICNETIPNETDQRQKELVELLDMKIYSEETMDMALRKAGFSDVMSFRKKGTEWVCVIAKK